MPLRGSKASRWTTRLDEVPELAVYALWVMSGEPGLKEYLSRWRHFKTNISGADLKARGLPPGPRYTEILSRLRAAWLDGEVASREDELALLERLI